MSKDTLYREPIYEGKDFVFDERVAAVFDDMISRSVPFYREVQEAATALTCRLARPRTTVYDLGCSTGTTLLALGQNLKDESIRIVGIDSSPPMIDRCNEKLAESGLEKRVVLKCEDISKLEYKNASVVILNFTLQFIPLDRRHALLSSLFAALIPGGALILSEKIRFDNPELQQLCTEVHHSFKRLNGYTELEVSRKREALEKVLKPLTLEENMELLLRAGFKVVQPLVQCWNFASIAAIKT